LNEAVGSEKISLRFEIYQESGIYNKVENESSGNKYREQRKVPPWQIRIGNIFDKQQINKIKVPA